jgi:hypothetical protein
LTKFNQIKIRKCIRYPEFLLYTFCYVNIQTPLVNYIIQKVTQLFDFSGSDHRPPEIALIRLISDLVSMNFNCFTSTKKMPKMRGKIKEQLGSCTNLVQFEWKRTHLEGNKLVQQF